MHFKSLYAFAVVSAMSSWSTNAPAAIVGGISDSSALKHAVACDSVVEFVSQYSSEQKITQNAKGEIHVVARITDFSRFGECVSKGHESVDAEISAAGNSLSFECDGCPVTIEALVARDYDARFGTETHPPRDFEAWHALHFKSGPQGDGTEDSDKDGRSDLLEYALDTDPTTADFKDDAAFTIGSANVDGNRYVTLTYTRDLRKTDITLDCECSSDLVNWTTDGMVDTVVEADAENQIETRVAGAPAGNGRMFLRLRVRRN